MNVSAVNSFVASVATSSKSVATPDVTTDNSVDDSPQPVAKVQNDSTTTTSDVNNKTGSSTATTTTKPLTEGQLTKATDELNNFMQSMNTDIKFKLHVATNQLMIQVEDSKTHKILKECPPHEVLDMVARMKEYLGSLVDKKA